MKTPKISIIVPVYNAERCLHRCIDSILAPTFRDFELLLIDDGSKDNSGYICDEYAEKDERVKVWHKENGGVSSARNVGLDNARGEWVTFADSDDWLESNAFAYYDELTNKHTFDYLYCGYYLNDIPEISDIEGNFDILNFLNKSEFDKLWYGLYSRLVIKDNNIRFNETITLSEDKLFNYQFLKYCCQVYCAKVAFYHYSFGNTESLSFKGFNVENYLKCELLTANELREIDVIKADLYLKKSLKAIVWQNICTGVSFKQLRKIYDTFKLQPSVSSGIFKSKMTFSIYCILQQIKYKFRK